MSLRLFSRALRPSNTSVRLLRFSTSCIKQQNNNSLENKMSEMVRDYEQFNGIDTNGNALQDMVNFSDRQHISPTLEKLRVVPRDTSFYMANPPHEEIMRELNEILQQHINIPTIPRDQVDNKTTWLTQEEYQAMLGGEHFKPKYYKSLLKVLNRLCIVDPQLMPDQVRTALHPFTKRVSDNWAAKKYPTLDSIGRALAVGRRKSASARVQMVKSNENAAGQILVNGKSLDLYFPRLTHRQSIVYPFQVCGVESGFNTFITVTGGGPSGQADAVAQGIARALVIHNPLFLTRLSRSKCIQRDPRVKERKKPGKPKARKSYTWVKR